MMTSRRDPQVKPPRTPDKKKIRDGELCVPLRGPLVKIHRTPEQKKIRDRALRVPFNEVTKTLGNLRLFKDTTTGSNTCLLIGKGPSADEAHLYAEDSSLDVAALSHAAWFVPPVRWLFTTMKILSNVLKREVFAHYWVVSRADSNRTGIRVPGYVIVLDDLHPGLGESSLVAISVLAQKYENVLLIGFDGGMETRVGKPNPVGYDCKLFELKELMGNMAKKYGTEFTFLPAPPDGKVWVNLGSGRKYWPGWVNVDLYAEKVDRREDLRQVQFPKDTVHRAVSVHSLEHMTRDQGADLVVRAHHWLAPGGTLEIECPDRAKCKALMAAGRKEEGAKGLLGGRSDRPLWDEWIHKWLKAGRPDPDTFFPSDLTLPGEAHLYVWSADELMSLMKEIGFSKVDSKKPHYHGSRDFRDFRVVGTK